MTEFIQAVREFAEAVIPFITEQKNMMEKTCFSECRNQSGP